MAVPLFFLIGMVPGLAHPLLFAGENTRICDTGLFPLLAVPRLEAPSSFFPYPAVGISFCGRALLPRLIGDFSAIFPPK